MSELYDRFQQYFSVEIARSPGEIEDAQRLRYQVYCVEHTFEDPAGCPGGLEIDPYDVRSAHGLLRHCRTRKLVATVRLVLLDPSDPDAPFPIEEHCGQAFHPDFRPENLPRAKVAEISRFAVSKHFRQRRGEASTAHGLVEVRSGVPTDEEERRLLPHLTVGLFRAIVEMSRENEVTHWYAVMEPFLIRVLKKFGIEFERIGSPVEYHGKRIPCFRSATEVLAGIHDAKPDVWYFITDGGKIWPLEGW